MIYDAIINGARMLAFFGGNNPRCWNAADAGHAWSWTFWNTVLEGLIGEINAISPLAPALVNVGTTQVLHSSDATTQVISRAGNTNDLWVMAARGGTGTASVTIDGIPPTVTSGTVYTEGRSVSVANGSFTDEFDRWACTSTTSSCLRRRRRRSRRSRLSHRSRAGAGRSSRSLGRISPARPPSPSAVRVPASRRSRRPS